MIINYEVSWAEDNRLNIKTFSYEYDDNCFPLSSYLPKDVYDFYESRFKQGQGVAVFVGEAEKTGTGLLKICMSNTSYG